MHRGFVVADVSTTGTVALIGGSGGGGGDLGFIAQHRLCYLCSIEHRRSRCWRWDLVGAAEQCPVGLFVLCSVMGQ